MLENQHMSATSSSVRLSRREREFMEILYRLGRASVAQVRAEMAEPPTYSAVRAGLNLLEAKGHLRHEEVAGTYIYAPKVSREKARISQLRQMLNTFFNNSAEEMVATLLSAKETKASPAELDRLAELIKRAKNGHPL
jgi:predicted transcriptional regulator